MKCLLGYGRHGIKMCLNLCINPIYGQFQEYENYPW